VSSTKARRWRVQIWPLTCALAREHNGVRSATEDEINRLDQQLSTAMVADKLDMFQIREISEVGTH